MRLLWVLTFTVLSQASWAWPPTYGAEFEFSHPDFLHSSSDEKGFTKGHLEHQAKVRLTSILVQQCLKIGCDVRATAGKWPYSPDFLVEFHDGWWFKISHDPGVIEIMTKPATLEELRAQQERMDRMLFRTARDMGLKPSLPVDGPMAGHFNFGAKSAFGNDAELFLRFFLDFANRPWLALGGLGHDILNAPPLAFLSDRAHGELRAIILEFEVEKAEGKTPSLQDIAERVLLRVYRRSFLPEVRMDGNHYQAFSIKRAMRLNRSDDVPFEIRSVDAQESMKDFIMLAELIEARLRFLKKQKDPLEFIVNRQPSYTRQELYKLFKEYVEETGLSFAKYRQLLSTQSLDPQFPLHVLRSQRSGVSCSKIFAGH